MMGELIVRNLLHRPLRTLIGVLAVAVEVALVVLNDRGAHAHQDR